MIEKYEKPSFFVFTNDTFWAEKWCEVRERETGRRFTVVQGTDEETGYIDLMLMSLCKAHIIANSSFSWWGPGWTLPRISAWSLRSNGSIPRNAATFIQRIW